MTEAFLSNERLVDLLIQEVTTGLGTTETTEMEQLLARYPGLDRRVFESTAVALTVAARLPAEPLPPGLRARLLAAADGVAGAPKRVVDLQAVRSARDAIAQPASVLHRRPGVIGWWATAAALLIAIAGWYPRLAGPSHAPTAAQLRAQLLASNSTAVHWAFAATDDPGGAGATGDVVFDPATQRGYLRFHNLKPNDPRHYEYQLWIFDGERDARYPVDGGVFDIPAGSADVVVPITARIRVGKPELFAVTIEHPGGVVVSGREHIVVIAKPRHA